MKKLSYILVVTVLLGSVNVTLRAQTKKTTTSKSSSKTSSKTSVKTPATKTPAATSATVSAPAAPATPQATSKGKKGTAVVIPTTEPAAPSTPAPQNTPASTTPTGTVPAAAPPSATPVPALTSDVAAGGLRDALTQGIQKGVELVSKQDGYLKNPLIKIPFPQEFTMVEQGVRKIGLGSVADQAVESMNRAAEKAAGDALPIFLDAIKQLNFNDVFAILNGSSDRAATDFLQRTTSTQLTAKFKPIIGDALAKVDATKYWGTVVDAYNRIPLVQKVNPDLSGYVTEKAVQGLFTMVAQEEKNIRQNPAARATDLLQQVFGSTSKK